MVPLVLLAGGFAGCSGGQAGDPNNRGPFEVVLATTGFGQVYPYRINRLDKTTQTPTTEVINITKMDDLRNNVAATNAVLPVGIWPSGTATLPNGVAGNHYLLVKFSHDLRVESILSNLAANQSNSGLTGAIQVLEYDPGTETTSIVRGRGFVGGFTFYDNPATPQLDLTLTRAVSADKDGNVQILDARAVGFPLGFKGDEELVSSKSFVFVPDSLASAGLSNFDSFPSSKVIRLIVGASVQDHRQKSLTEEICSATTVGNDGISPEILGFSTGTFQITPGNGALGVDPTTSIRVSFSKPVQPLDVGQFFSTTDKTPATGGVSLSVKIANQTAPIIYYADPLTAGDLCNYTVTPAYFLPGSTVKFPTTVNIGINTTIKSLPGVNLGTQVTTTFQTGKGPGLVNAPVAPEAIYVGRAGDSDSTGVSVIDLNGFGQGTGDIDDTSFPRNPNLGQPGILPSYTPGTQNMDAGGKGALSLAQDTNLSTLLLDSAIVAVVGDIQLGQPLDKIFNNENINPFVTRANQINPATGGVTWGNVIQQAPVPNPPKLKFPPPNPAQNIQGEEPTISSTVPSPPCVASSLNKLVQGNPFATNLNSIGLFYTPSPGAFVGPQPAPGSPQPPTPPCPYTSRQQVGQFLYVLDRGKKQVLVVNSNRFQVIETIRLSDPFSMTVAPNLRRLAVTNFSAGTVSFIDIDPGSTTFHKVVGETRVGAGPTGIAWQVAGEDILVVNSKSNSVSVLNGADGTLRKTITGLLNGPIEVVTTLRQSGVGFQTGIYFAYILNSDGKVAIFESGPDGVNGIGFDDIIGTPEELRFPNARTLENDINSFNSGIWIGHTAALGGGAQVSHLELTDSLVGPQPIQTNQGGFILPPTTRQREWTVTGRLGGGDSATTPIKDRLSGNTISDIALDELQNLGGLADQVSTQVSNLVYALHSGKGQAKVVPGGLVPAITSRFVFAAVADKGFVDVIELDTGKVIRRIAAPGASVLSHYWRQ